MRICILGATGLVGRETLELVKRAYPKSEVLLYASREQNLEISGRTFQVKAATDLEQSIAPRGDLAFVALDDDYSRRFVPRLLQLGYRVVDKSNTYRDDPKVPLVVAGVNHQLVTNKTYLVANPNCTTIPLALALSPLDHHFGVKNVTVSTFQAVSGAGIAALDEFMLASQRGYSDNDRLGRSFSPLHYAGNAVPHSGKTDETGFSIEERKLVQENRKILGLPNLAISAQCTRVAVAVGHYETVWFTLRKSSSCNEIEDILSKVSFLRLYPGSSGDGLTALACVHDRDHALVGRIRRDERDDKNSGFCMTICADNLRFGAATNAVRIASAWYPSSDRELDLATLNLTGQLKVQFEKSFKFANANK